jgi:hypothetical protein
MVNKFPSAEDALELQWLQKSNGECGWNALAKYKPEDNSIVFCGDKITNTGMDISRLIAHEFGHRLGFEDTGKIITPRSAPAYWDLGLEGDIMSYHRDGDVHWYHAEVLARIFR